MLPVFLLGMPTVSTVLAQRTIAGYVTHGPGGSGVSGAEVRVFGGLRRRGDRPLRGEAVTDRLGAFRIEGVAGETLMVQVTAPGFARAALMLNREDPTEELAFVLAPGRKGTVRVVRGDGRPVEGAHVACGLVAGTTDANGVVVLEALPQTPEGPSTVEVRADGFVGASRPFPAGEEDVDWTISLARGRELPVVVIDDLGQPVAGAVVHARLTTAVAYSPLERAEYRGVTDAQGRAVIRGIPPHFPVCVEVEDALLGTQSPVVIPGDDGDGPPATVQVSKGRSIGLRVLDDEGEALANAEVRVLPLVEPLLDFGGGVERENVAGAIRTGRSGLDGRARFDRLPASPVTCEIRLPGWTTRMIVLRPPLEPTAPCDVVLERDERTLSAPPPWARDLTAALNRSRDESLPVVFALARDAERANDWVAAHHYRDPEVLRMLASVDTFLINLYGAGGMESTGHDEVDGVCQRYGGISCAEHQAHGAWAVDEFIGASVPFEVPRHLVVSSQGHVLFDRSYYLSERELVRLVVAALRHDRPDLALRRARSRLQLLRSRLIGPDADQAVEDLLSLINSGDEDSVTLLADLRILGVSEARRTRVAGGMVGNALTLVESALEPLVIDGSPRVRRALAPTLAEMAPSVGRHRLMARLLAESDPAEAEELWDRILLGFPRDTAGGRYWCTAEGLDTEAWRVLLAGMALAPVADDPRVPDELTEVLNRGDEAAVAATLRVLGQVGQTSPWAAALLMAELDRDDLRGVLALRVLRVSGLPNVEPGTVAERRMESSSILVREEAARLAGRGWDATSRKVLRSALADPERSVRLEAAAELFSLREPSSGSILLDVMNDPVLAPMARNRLVERTQNPASWSAEDWRRWILTQGVIPTDGEDR